MQIIYKIVQNKKTQQKLKHMYKGLPRTMMWALPHLQNEKKESDFPFLS